MRLLLRHALAAMMPGTDNLPGAGGDDLGAFVDRFWSESSWLMWLGVVGSTLVFMVTPVVTVGRPVPSWWLSAAMLDRHAHEMSVHRVYTVRQCAFLIKMVVGLYWGSRDDVRSALGLKPYPPDPGTWRTT